MLKDNKTGSLSALGERLRHETSFDLTYLLTKLGPHEYAVVRDCLWHLAGADPKPTT